MRRLSILVACAAAAAACATPYRPPQTPPPVLWTGVSGLEPAGPSTADSGRMREGAIFFSTPVHFRRTGVLARTVRTKTAYGGDMVLPEGSKAYATNYTLYVGSAYSAPENVQTEVDPVEWCVIAEQGFDGRGAGSQTACIFWEGPERARYMQDYTTGGFAFAPYVDIGSASGMTGPVPEILEQPVDFGVQITREARVLKVEKRGVRVGIVLSDRNKHRVMEQNLVRWGSTLALGGKLFRFQPVADDPDAVEVSVA